MVYRTLQELDLSPGDLPVLSPPGRVLMARPTYFDVTYAINPYMADQIGKVNVDRARRQWNELRNVYVELGYTVDIIEGVPGLPDMVFSANQTLPYLMPDGSKHVLLSRMHAEQRRDEVPHFRSVFEEHGYTIHEIPEAVEGSFEGMGDGLWHRGHDLLWGGYGIRTDLSVYEWLADELDLAIVALELEDPRFYHLDTCLSLLDPHSALVYPGALTLEGRQLVENCFDTVIEVPEQEATDLLACNAHCPDGTHVLIQEGCDTTVSELSMAGFRPIEVDVSEFLRAGGSVSCMKLMYW